MAEEYEDQDVAPVPGVGAQLRAAREARGLSLPQLASDTRIPLRHLETIESGDFSAMPARTYAIGFSRTYAKAVGLNDADVADMVRAELDAAEPKTRARPASFEPGDPARVPSSKLVWALLGALIILLLGGFFFMRTLFAPAAELPSLVEQEQAAQVAQRQQQRPGTARAAASPSGPVVFTALEEAWEKLMAKGETYTVPADANQPMVRTGRPDALRITIGGRTVPKLAEEQRVVGDVLVTAEALLARGRQTPATTPTAAASPTT
jgi:cytoskeletal protein RodZ